MFECPFVVQLLHITGVWHDLQHAISKEIMVVDAVFNLQRTLLQNIFKDSQPSFGAYGNTKI